MSIILHILIAFLFLATPALANTYIYAPPVAGVQTAQGAPYTPPNGVTLPQAWPGGMAANFVDITALGANQPVPGSTYANGVWTAPVVVAPVTTAAQNAAALLAGGVTITSTSTPALNGVYALDDGTRNTITAVSTFILVNPGTFPSGSSQAFLDMAGSPHVFTSPTQFQAFASAVARVVALVDLYGAGVIPTAPSMSVTIP